MLVRAGVLLTLLVALTVPIFVTLRRGHPSAPAAERPSEDGSTAGTFELALLALLAAGGLVAWTTLSLAEIGVFSTRLLVVVDGFVALLLLWLVFRPWPRLLTPREPQLVDPRASRWRWPRLADLRELAFVPLIALAAFLFFPADEWIIGGIDAGAYVNGAAAIAETGGIIVRDPDIVALSPAGREALLREKKPGPGTAGTRLIGMYLRDADPTTLVPHGFHLFPATLAIGYSIDAVRGALATIPVLATFGVLLLYALGRRLFGQPVGLLAAAWLALNLGNVYFARYPAAEMLAQPLVLAGLLALLLLVDTGRPSFGLLTGFFFGLSHLNKIEIITLPVAIALFLGWEIANRRWQRGYTNLVVVYGLLVLQSALHAAYFATWYSYVVLSSTLLNWGILTAVVVAALAVGIAVIFVLRRTTSGRTEAILVPVAERWRQRAFVAARFGLVTGLGTLALYAYFVRPEGSTPPDGASLGTLAMSTVNDVARRQSFIRLGWYVTVGGLLLGVVGQLQTILRQLDRRTVALVALAGFEAMLWLAEPRIHPAQFYAARRFVPVVWPAIALFGAAAIAWLWPRAKSPGSAVLPIGLCLLITISLITSLRPFVPFREYAGSIDQIGAFADRFPPNAVVLFDNSDASLRVSLPTEYLFHRTSFVAWEWVQADDKIAAALADWRAQGRPVYYVAGSDPAIEPNPKPPAWPIELTPISTTDIVLPESVASFDHVPNAVTQLHFAMRVYKIGEPVRQP